ncbi:MAG TPA: acyltransferase [Gemmatimonadales bacterium]
MKVANPGLISAGANWRGKHHTDVTAPAQRPHHLPSLDGLRACAILLVIVAHLTHTLAESSSLFTVFGDLGNLGVRIFFILSGFLITQLLLREEVRSGSISLRRFYLRRVLRIFPAFFFFIAAMVAASRLGWIPLPTRDVLFAATFLANFQTDRGWYLGHTWSLAVEEQFYLIWPTIFLLAGKRWRLTVAIAAVIIAPVVRVGVFLMAPEAQRSIGEIFPTIMDTIAIGAALALARQALHQRDWYLSLLASRWCLAIPIAVLACNWFIFAFAWPGWLLGETLLNLTIVFGIDRALTHSTGMIGRVLNLPMVAWIGTLSYSLYLWQQPYLPRAGRWPLQLLPWNVLALTGCAILSYYLVERPFVKLKDRLGRQAHA